MLPPQNLSLCVRSHALFQFRLARYHLQVCKSKQKFVLQNSKRKPFPRSQRRRISDSSEKPSLSNSGNNKSPTKLNPKEQQYHHYQEKLHNGEDAQSQFYFFRVLFYRLTLAYGGIYCISEYGFQLTNCNGPSMLPTMNSVGEIIFVDRFTPRLFGIQDGSRGVDRIYAAQKRQSQHENPEEWHQPFVPSNEIPPEGKWKRFFANLRTGINVGDIVVVEHPRREGTICKRVLGLPGDDIILKKSQYGPSHFIGKKRGSIGAAQRRSLQRVPDGHIWLEGDNSSNSLDSRTYGTVPASMIVGRVPFRVWPLRGNAIYERGMRPKQRLGEPRWGAQGSTVIPAGYEGQRIIKEFTHN